MTIRELDPERDAGGIVELLLEAMPLAVLDRDSWLHRLRTIPERAQQAGWVAEDAGSVSRTRFMNLEPPRPPRNSRIWFAFGESGSVTELGTASSRGRQAPVRSPTAVS
jgi:hypothetical protein